MSIITRFTIAAFLAAASSLVGLFFAKRLRARARYFEALVGFAGHILTEVKFRKSSIKEIAREYKAQNPSPLDKNLEEFIASDNFADTKLSRGILKKEEVLKTKQFFLSLGTLDSETQIYELESYKENLSAQKEKAKTIAEKYSPMVVKLGFLAGLALAIVFV